MNVASGAAYVLDQRALQIAGAIGRPLALWPSSLGMSFSSLPVAAVVPRGDDGGGDQNPDGEGDDEENDEQAIAAALGGVALVRIQGPLAQRGERGLCALVDGYDWITARFAKALEVARAVVLVIDSPGGDGAGLIEAVRRMRAMADEADKPVFAYIDETAASAAYWIASGVADEICLPETGRVGSIGCIAVHVDVTEWAAKEGYQYTIVRDPGGKAAGTAYEKLDDTGRERIERSVVDLSTRFAAAVAERRGVDAGELRAMNADVLQGAAAVRAGLADAVATLEETIRRAATAAVRKETEMKTNQAVRTMLGLAEGATDDDVTKAAKAAAPTVALGRVALALTGAADTESAEGTLRAWKDANGRAAALGEELEKFHAVEKTRAEETETVDRVRLVVAAIQAGKMTPGEAWALDVDEGGELRDPGAAPKLATALAEMKPKTFRGFIQGRMSLPASFATGVVVHPRNPGAVDGSASDEEATEAKRAGVSVESLRKAKNRVRNASAIAGVRS